MGEPRPPAPISSTFDLSSLACPASPTSGMSRCRLYGALRLGQLTGISSGSPASFQAAKPPLMLRTRV